MRVKTTKNTLEMLPELTKSLKLNSNAETLKLAISFAFNAYPDANKISSFEYPSEDGFEIDTHILFGTEHELYMEILCQYFDTKSVLREQICLLIDIGFQILYREFKLAKMNSAKLSLRILELSCI